MQEVLDDAGAGELLQVAAGLAQLDPDALDVADPEPLADQVVYPDAAHHDLPPGLCAGEADIFESLGFDQGQGLPGGGSVAEELAVAL